MQSLKYNIKELYFKSRCYFHFTIFQLLISLTIILYVLIDHKTILGKKITFSLELTIALLMIIDIIIYGLINGFKFETLTILEYVIIILFLSVFIYIGYQGIDEIDEDIEFVLMFGRFILQLIRFFIGLVRIRENSQKRVTAKSFSLDTDEDSRNLDQGNSQEFVLQGKSQEFVQGKSQEFVQGKSQEFVQGKSQEDQAGSGEFGQDSGRVATWKHHDIEMV